MYRFYNFISIISHRRIHYKVLTFLQRSFCDGVIYGELLKLTIEQMLNFVANLWCNVTKYGTQCPEIG
jgi:hypothetical protein